jgi:hypothetical protein
VPLNSDYKNQHTYQQFPNSSDIDQNSTHSPLHILLQVIWNLLHFIHELKAKNSNLAAESSRLKEQVDQPV